MKKLFTTKGFFIFNLILFGTVLGFSLALFSFSCSTKLDPAETAYAEANGTASLNLESLQSSFRNVAKTVLPVVTEVNVIEVMNQTTPGGDTPWFDFFFGDPGEEDGEDREYRSQGLGSGVIVRKDSDFYYVITNNHVIGEADEISITLYDGREFEAELVGKDPRKDLALVKFKADDKSIPVVVLGDSSELQVGDWVLAVGNPFGFESTVTAGIVSALGRKGGPDGNISDFIQTDAAINRGNSGGALVNLRGELVGLNTWITSPTGGSIGLGFSIPINNVKKAISDFIEKGEVEYGWLGVSVADLQTEVARALGVEDINGAFVYHVFKNSPAYKGGIRPGDYITKISDYAIEDADDLVLIVGDLLAGEKIDFEIIRLGESALKRVTIGRREDQQAIDNLSKNLWPGISVYPLTDDLKTELEVPQSTNGVIVQNVENRTPTSIAGLRAGDIITAINRNTIDNVMDFYRYLNEDVSEIRIDYIRDGAELNVGIKK